MPISDYLDQDGKDRRFALEAAINTFASLDELYYRHPVVLQVADDYYKWLRQRDTLVVSLTIEAGNPQPADTKKGQ